MPPSKALINVKISFFSSASTLPTNSSVTEKVATALTNANPEDNEIKTADEHRQLLFKKLKKMDEESCVDPLLVKMLRETTSAPETNGKIIRGHP